jgi:fatty acid desaturase
MFSTFPCSRLIWHFDLKKFNPNQQNRVKISLAAVTAFAAVAWPLIIANAGVIGWVKFWLLPWLGFHFWVSQAASLPLHFFPNRSNSWSLRMGTQISPCFG